LSEIARKMLPADVVNSVARARKRYRRSRVERLPQLTETEFTSILVDRLGLGQGKVVYVHSSIDRLNLGFPFYRILPLIQNVIGERGTFLFPTYPNRSPVSSYEYLRNGNVFDVRRTPSYTGILTEFARRHGGATRSLHPTKSVCAIGPAAVWLTSTHQESLYPYDVPSPYYKLIESEATIVGIGVWTEYLSFVYCIDDAMKDNQPVQTYHPEIFRAKCINYAGEEQIVATYAHDMTRCIHDIPQFMKRHIAADVCEDIVVNGMKFFRADASRLFAAMLPLAERGITVYPRSVYSESFQPRP
ncbi:MAG TPA: AAC(3) family N-acetyltransferase, partial [Pyrinomonadaceae bacterium]|nr:AAC(3) family N-acetyltransferase [Pyrinomonadaceae bacterium]